MTATAAILNLVAACLAVGSVIAYENAYDLFERRNRRLYEPRGFHSVPLYDDGNGFFPGNGYLRPERPRPQFGAFGNGYDNLGNGIPVGPDRSFRQEFANGWRFDRRPFRAFPERPFDDFRFLDRLTSPRDFVRHRPGEYYPAFRRNHPSPGNVYGDVYGNEYRRGGEEIDRYVQENEGKKQTKTDEIYQNSQEGVTMGSSRAEKSGEELRTDQTGENKSSVRSNKVLKKGRTTKGFAVHHHKDETGNSTTFFDESSDFGGQSDLRDFSDGFGTKKTLEQVVDKGEEKYFKENGGQTGNYGSGLLAGSEKFEKDFTSGGNRQESGGEFPGEGEREGLHLGKRYRYLSGEPFEYVRPEVDNYY